MTAINWPDFSTCTYPSHIDTLSEGILSSYRVYIWYGKDRITGLQSGEGRMMIDSVVWAQYINATDAQTDTQTNSHVAIVNAAPMHWRRAAKTSGLLQ